MLAFLSAIAAFACTVEAWRSPARRRICVAVGLVCLVALVFAVPPKEVLAKAIGRCMMPVGLMWLAGIAATGLSWALEKRLVAGVTAVITFGFMLCGNFWLGGAWLTWLEADYVNVDPFASEYDAVAVLGGGVTTNRLGRAQLTAGGDRLILGAQLYYAAKTEVLVTSGRSLPGANENLDVSAATRDVWVALGVPASAIRMVADPFDTRSEVAAYQQLAEAEGWDNMAIVSSAWHLRRVKMHADALDAEFALLGADFRGGPSWEGLASVVPTGVGFFTIGTAAWETLGGILGPRF